MGPKRFYSQNFSLFIVKFKKLGFSAPLIVAVEAVEAAVSFWERKRSQQKTTAFVSILLALFYAALKLHVKKFNLAITCLSNHNKSEKFGNLYQM